MIKGKCQAQDCEFLVEDGLHIDDVVQKLHEHWRAQHPTKLFSAQRHGERASQFNMEWDEILAAHYGPNWQQAGVEPENDLYTLSDISRNVNYNPEVIAQATALVDAFNQRRANAPADGPLPAAGRRFRRPGGGAGIVHPGPPQPAPFLDFAPEDGDDDF